MALEIRSIKGTQDVLPADTYKWQFVERLFLDTAKLYGFNEIRIPTFEDKSLFIRSVGDTVTYRPNQRTKIYQGMILPTIASDDHCYLDQM